MWDLIYALIRWEGEGLGEDILCAVLYIYLGTVAPGEWKK